MISLEEEPCCKSMQWAIKKWALYADWIDNSLSINEELLENEIPADDFKFCPWCSKPIPPIDEWEFSSNGRWERSGHKVDINNGNGPNIL